ncbi:hypothetical protein C8R43DRAFT_1036515 [Mycena crocata]|nr:hypothetical protein C8R43DRAFT_1036515 [Mycena crocata]
MAPLPNVELSYGPMLIGVFCNMILYGVFVGQALTYYQLYHKDETWMRYFVLYLFVLETLNTALDMAMMYQPLILEYGRQPNNFPAVFLTQPMLVVLIATPIQLFFAWRIWTITRPRFGWLPFVIGAFAVAACAGGLWTAVKVGLIGKFARKPELHVSALLWFLASCVADVLITISLVMTLSHRKTGFVATDTVIDKIIRSEFSVCLRVLGGVNEEGQSRRRARRSSGQVEWERHDLVQRVRSILLLLILRKHDAAPGLCGLLSTGVP